MSRHFGPRCLSDLADLAPAFRPLLAEQVADWAPEPPAVTLALGVFGFGLVANADPAVPAETAAVFAYVEGMLRDGTAADRDAAATGFLEGVSAALDDAPHQRWILAHAGPEALAYLAAWDQFWGIGPRP